MYYDGMIGIDWNPCPSHHPVIAQVFATVVHSMLGILPYVWLIFLFPRVQCSQPDQPESDPVESDFGRLAVMLSLWH